MPRHPSPSTASRGPAAAQRVTSLEQVRALGDPKKLRLLAEFATPRTTMEVAKSLRQPATALYRHVNALWRLGLLRVISERQKRGTVERTFQVAAHQFQIAESLFPSGTAMQAEARRTFQEAERGFLAACPAAGPDPNDPAGPMIAGIEMFGTPTELARVRKALFAALTRLRVARSKQAKSERASAKPERAQAMLVFYPVRSDR